MAPRHADLQGGSRESSRWQQGVKLLLFCCYSCASSVFPCGVTFERPVDNYILYWGQMKVRKKEGRCEKDIKCVYFNLWRQNQSSYSDLNRPLATCSCHVQMVVDSSSMERSLAGGLLCCKLVVKWSLFDHSESKWNKVYCYMGQPSPHKGEIVGFLFWRHRTGLCVLEYWRAEENEDTGQCQVSHGSQCSLVLTYVAC